VVVDWCSIPGGAFQAIWEVEGHSFTMKTYTLMANGDRVYAYQLLGWSDVWE
jgi:hypothetical protein